MTENNDATERLVGRDRYRVGAVSFFNTRPLTYTLADNDRVDVSFDVPSRLAGLMEAGSVDCALVPSIDYQRTSQDWFILPIAAIASQGEVLTVRIMSRRPLDEIECLACDGDSHTSIVLAGVVWQLRFGRELPMKPLAGPIEAEQAVLLIGDKVLGQLPNWPYQLDLGQAWFELTSLPFVYAFWACPSETVDGHLCELLQNAATEGRKNIDAVIAAYAGRHGFSNEVAQRYFAENICFDFGKRQQRGLCRFYELAQQYGLIDKCRPLRFYSPVSEPSATESTV
ncbi:MAG: menaquinone biosynthesis protein [Sedimentisphaerales bacterium]|nr:menaquinone biosynthesis protein [Sedimentisphaerales bacterium]